MPHKSLEGNNKGLAGSIAKAFHHCPEITPTRGCEPALMRSFAVCNLDTHLNCFSFTAFDWKVVPLLIPEGGGSLRCIKAQ